MMNELFEKIKSLDKRVLIGAGVAVAVLLILIIVLVVNGGKKPADANTQDTQTGTETEVSTEVFGTEDVTEEIGTEEATETEMATETEVEGLEVQTSTQPGQSSVTITPDGQEILGLGSKDEPYEVIPDTSSGVSVTTVEVPAGKTLYYKVQRIGGMYLNINDSDLYVIESNGTRHDSSFTVENALSSDFVLLQIGNKGSSPKAFTIKFSDLKGTQMNPEEISDLSGSKDLSAGDEDGWYYRYYATQSGTIKFYIEYTAESDITVYNKNSYAQRSFESDGEGKEYIELDVTAGDEIEIHICAKPDDSWEYPATTITWRGEY